MLSGVSGAPGASFFLQLCVTMPISFLDSRELSDGEKRETKETENDKTEKCVSYIVSAVNGFPTYCWLASVHHCVVVRASENSHILDKACVLPDTSREAGNSVPEFRTDAPWPLLLGFRSRSLVLSFVCR